MVALSAAEQMVGAICIHLSRPMQAPTILKQLEERLGRVIVRIGSLTCTVIFILHIFACVFHYVALLDERNGTWVQLSGIVNQNSKWDRCAACTADVHCTRVLVAAARLHPCIPAIVAATVPVSLQHAGCTTCSGMQSTCSITLRPDTSAPRAPQHLLHRRPHRFGLFLACSRKGLTCIPPHLRDSWITCHP